MKKKWTSQKGGPAIEFALVLPVLCILVLGLMECAILMYDKAVITNASREGARRGIVYQVPAPTIEEVTNTVDDYCSTHLITFGGSFTPSTVVPQPPDSLESGDPLTVTVWYSYTFLVFPNFIPGFPNVIPLNATTVMRME